MLEVKRKVLERLNVGFLDFIKATFYYSHLLLRKWGHMFHTTRAKSHPFFFYMVTLLLLIVSSGSTA